MRIYLLIALVALSLLGAMALTAQFWVGDFLKTEEFRRTAFIEIGSFIATSAVVGGLSAAVADYLRRRELLPLRQHAFARIDSLTREALKRLHQIMMESPSTDELAFRRISNMEFPVIATTEYRVTRFSRCHGGMFRANWHRIAVAMAGLDRCLDRYATSFSIERQDDLAKIELFFDLFRQRMNNIDAFLGNGPAVYRSSSYSFDEILNEYQSLRDALIRVAGECDAESETANFINLELNFFANDHFHVSAALVSSNPEHEHARSLISGLDVDLDYAWSEADLEKRISARVPRSVLGVEFETAISEWDADKRYGPNQVVIWRKQYPPTSVPSE